MDQKNWLYDLVKKRKAKEDERKDAAKHMQAVATTSAQLVEALSRTPPAQAENITAIMEEKMAAMKNDIMWGIRVKMDESSKVKDNLNFHFGPC